MYKRRSTLLILAAVVILACSCPAIAATGTATPGPAAPVAPPPTTAASAEVPTSTVAAAAPPTACSAQLTANASVNVRGGPGTVYSEVGYLNMGQTAPIDGQNAEGTWWRIVYAPGPGGHGWVAASVSTATCASGIAAVLPPATPTEEIQIGVTGISVSVDPKEIHVAGCMGPIQPSTAYATIEVNGPITVKAHFNTDQMGALPNHTLHFNKAGSADISDSFTPPVSGGNYWVRLVIDGVDLSSFNIQAKYKIVC